MAQQDRYWYVVQTYSGYENSVKINLEHKIQNDGLEDKIFDILIPEEIEIVENAKGEKKEKPKKMFPGYIFIDMIVTEASWYAVRNTPGVTGLLGSSGGGAKPVPVPQHEIDAILQQIGKLEKPTFDAKVGDRVSVQTGPFAGQIGVIDAIDESKELVTVLVDMFGRQTPVEVSFQDIKAV